MNVPRGRPTIARRFDGGFRSLKPIESRRDERKHGFANAISAAPSGLSPFVFTPTVKTVGHFLSSRWDLICAARTPPQKTSLERQIVPADAQIVHSVYDLYGLTGDEINIVEEAAK